MTQTWQIYQTQLVAQSGLQAPVPIGHPGNRITVAAGQSSREARSLHARSATQIVWLPGIGGVRSALPLQCRFAGSQ
jgi:hypothetical protein